MSRRNKHQKAASPRTIALPQAAGPSQAAVDPRAQIAKGFQKNLWYENGLRFKCTQCGNCCTGGPGYVWLTIDDMVKIAGQLGMPFDDFTRQYVKRVGTRYSLMEMPNYDCVFLRRDEHGKAGCAIYHVRPAQCRTWPFWNQNLRAPEAWTAASSNCPGMCDADAPLYDVEHIEKCRNHPESP